MTSKKKKKDWYPATQIYFTEEPPSKPLVLPLEEDPHDISGYYDIRRHELWVDPKQEEKTKNDEVLRTPPSSLAHEIGHFKLKHKSMTLNPGLDREGREEFFEPILDFSKAMGMLNSYKLEAVRNEVFELEVRLLQEVEGWAQDTGDDFISHFKELYIEGNAEYHARGNKDSRRIPIEISIFLLDKSCNISRTPLAAIPPP